MFQRLRPLFGLALCVLPVVPASGQDLPFLGAWDCGVGTFTLTATSYNNGSDELAIEEVQEGTDGSWTLFFADDYTITLSGITDEAMGWFSSSGESLDCRRVQ